jgi:hypothetical protein
MRGMSSFAGILLLMAGASFAGQLTPNTRTSVASDRLAAQVGCENRLFRAARAKETTSGPEHQVLLEVTSAFGRKEMPHLYIAEEGNNAAYIAGSSLVDGKGKIIISRRFIKLLANKLALKGILAHEMGHLVSDEGACGCDQWILRDPMQEIAIDALAAKTVGYSAIRAFFLRIKETQGGRSTDVDNRLQAIDELEKRSRNQPSSVAASSYGVNELDPYSIELDSISVAIASSGFLNTSVGRAGKKKADSLLGNTTQKRCDFTRRNCCKSVKPALIQSGFQSPASVCAI